MEAGEPLERQLATVEAALGDGHASITTTLGGIQEVVEARLWRGQVLVDWEPDDTAGGCLLQPRLARRLISLHALTDSRPDRLTIVAPRSIVAALSDHHADLVKKLGSPRRTLELRIHLRFDGDRYVGGDETYVVIERGVRVNLLRLTAEVRLGPPPGSARTSPSPS